MKINEILKRYEDDIKYYNELQLQYIQADTLDSDQKKAINTLETNEEFWLAKYVSLGQLTGVSYLELQRFDLLQESLNNPEANKATFPSACTVSAKVLITILDDAIRHLKE